MSRREQVAKEAARILYSNKVKEYIEAKELAAANCGYKIMPSNFEIAIELDRIVEDREGSERLVMLVDMRFKALEIMKRLKEYNPILIGSVWRGTSRRGSDIDIIVYHSNLKNISNKLLDYHIIQVEKKSFILNGLPRTSTHIDLITCKFKVEIIVRPTIDIEHYKDERCEIYGDLKKGVNLQELERLIELDPLRRFIPKRRIK